MMRERRKSPRIKVYFSARWEGVLAQQDGTISDLSTGGCFILTPGDVIKSELIRVEIFMPEGEPLALWGEVVEHFNEIGFSLRFTGGSGEEEARLAQFIQQVLDSNIQ